MRYKHPRKLTNKQANDVLSLRYDGSWPIHAIPGAIKLIHNIEISEQFAGSICSGNRYEDVHQEFIGRVYEQTPFGLVERDPADHKND